MTNWLPNLELSGPHTEVGFRLQKRLIKAELPATPVIYNQYVLIFKITYKKHREYVCQVGTGTADKDSYSEFFSHL